MLTTPFVATFGANRHKKLLLSRRLPFCDKARRLLDHEITKLEQSLYLILTPHLGHLGVHSHTR